MKNKLFIILGIATIFVSGCSCSVKPKEQEKEELNVNENNTIIVTEEGVVGEQTVNGIALENINFSVQDGITSVVTKVKNNNTIPFELTNYQMMVKDSSGNVLTILVSSVNATLLPGEEQNYTTTFMLDLSSASTVEYAVNVIE